MDDTAWFLIIGALLTAMAFAGSVLKRAPLSAAMLYLAAGYTIGPRARACSTAVPGGGSRR